MTTIYNRPTAPPGNAGYAQQPTPPDTVPWYYDAEHNLGQIASYIPPTLWSYLPPIISLRH